MEKKYATNSGQTKSSSLETIIVETINVHIDQAFDYIPPINLMHIFRGNNMGKINI